MSGEEPTAASDEIDLEETASLAEENEALKTIFSTPPPQAPPPLWRPRVALLLLLLGVLAISMSLFFVSCAGGGPGLASRCGGSSSSSSRGVTTEPTAAPATDSFLPTSAPTSSPPSVTPTGLPTSTPSAQPSTATPSAQPSTATPSAQPSTATPSALPTTLPPTASPSTVPTALPTTQPPTASPSTVPTAVPSTAPTFLDTPQAPSQLALSSDACDFSLVTSQRTAVVTIFASGGRPLANATSSLDGELITFSQIGLDVACWVDEELYAVGSNSNGDSQPSVTVPYLGCCREVSSAEVCAAYSAPVDRTSASLVDRWDEGRKPLVDVEALSQEIYARSSRGPRGRASTLEVRMARDKLFDDSRLLKLAYQLRDAVGNSKVEPAVVSMEIRECESCDVTKVNCGAAGETSGAGTCEATIPLQWFRQQSALAVVYASYGEVAATSTTQTVILLPSPVLPPANTDVFGARVSADKHRYFPGETITLRLIANAVEGERVETLELWTATISFGAKLQFIDATPADAYTALVVSEREGEVTLGTSGVKVGSSTPSGTDIEMCTVRLLVRPSEGELDLSVVIDDMVSRGSTRFFTGAATFPAVLTVDQVKVAGLLPYVRGGLNEFVASHAIMIEQPLTYLVQAASISTDGTFQEVEVEVSGGEESVVELTGNSIRIVGNRGARDIRVMVKVGDQEALLLLSVWAPKAATVELESEALRRIGSCSHRWSESRYAVLFEFSDGADSVSQLDLTPLSTLTTSDASIALVEEASIVGLRPGVVDLVYASPELLRQLDDGSAPTLVVSDEAKNVVSLDAALVNYDDVNGRLLETANLDNVLGASAILEVVALFDDGTEMNVTANAKSELTPEFQRVMSTFITSSEVRILASDVEPFCGEALKVSWSPCEEEEAVAAASLIIAKPPVEAVAAVISTSTLRIAHSRDAASKAPFAVPTVATLSCELRFVDGESRDFSDDPRTSFSVIEGDAALTGRTLAVLDGEGSVNVRCSVSYFGEQLSANITLVVVLLETLVLEAPSTTLRKLACSSVYERTTVTALARLSDGTPVDVTSFVGLTATDNVDVDQTTGVVVGRADGQTTLRGSLQAVNATLALRVANDLESELTALSWTEQGSTFSGVLGSLRNFSVLALASDGQEYAGARVDFTSSAASIALKQRRPSEVTATLLSNSRSAVVLDAVSSCDASLSASLELFANLEPEFLDVDLGASEGPPLSFDGDLLSVDVRVHVKAALVSFDLVIVFDDSVLQVESDADCLIGPGLESINAWECATNDPVDTVRLVGACIGSACPTGIVTVATIRFRKKTDGLATIGGTISKLEDSDGASVADAEILAGAVGDGRRRSRLLRGRKQGRRMEEECFVLGDTNEDCSFDSSDVVALQRYYYGGCVDDSISGWVRRQLNADRSLSNDDRCGAINGVDIQYLLRVLAFKYRFIEDLTATADQASLKMGVQIFDSDGPASAEQTVVFFEVVTELNREMMYNGTYEVTDTLDGVLMRAEEQGNGVFEVSAQAVAVEEQVGVVMLVETFDALGRTADDRKFAFFCSRVYEGTPMCSQEARPFATVDIVELGLPPSPQPTAAPTVTFAPTSLADRASSSSSSKKQDDDGTIFILIVVFAALAVLCCCFCFFAVFMRRSDMQPSEVHAKKLSAKEREALAAEDAPFTRTSNDMTAEEEEEEEMMMSRSPRPNNSGPQSPGYFVNRDADEMLVLNFDEIFVERRRSSKDGEKKKKKKKISRFSTKKASSEELTIDVDYDDNKPAPIQSFSAHQTMLISPLTGTRELTPTYPSPADTPTRLASLPERPRAASEHGLAQDIIEFQKKEQNVKRKEENHREAVVDAGGVDTSNLQRTPPRRQDGTKRPGRQASMKGLREFSSKSLLTPSPPETARRDFFTGVQPPVTTTSVPSRARLPAQHQQQQGDLQKKKKEDNAAAANDMEEGDEEVCEGDL